MDDVSFTRSTLNLGTSREALGVTPGCPARVGNNAESSSGQRWDVKRWGGLCSSGQPGGRGLGEGERERLRARERSV